MGPDVTTSTLKPVRSAVPGTHSSNLKPGDDVLAYLRAYARERPDVAAMWCFGIGFVLGWKLKPW